MKYSKFITVGSIGICIALTSFGATESAPATTPDVALMNVAKSIGNNEPGAIFKALPASYQKEISSVISEAATKMDAELWAEGRGLIKSLVNIAKTKKDLLLQTQMMADVQDKVAFSKSWDDGVAMLETILANDITNLEKLRKGDVNSLLVNASEIMKKFSALYSDQADKDDDFLAKIKALKVTVISQEGDKATVKIETVGEEPENEEMVRVEGKWIPKDLAEGFAEGIKEARKNIAEIDFTSEKGKAQKTQIMGQLTMVKTLLVQAESATTPQQFDGMLMGIMMGVMSSGAGGMTPTPAPAQ